MHILVADDHAPTLRQLARTLGALGRVTAVSNGFEALAAFHATAEDDPYDLVLVDLAMPLCDGHTVARQLRADTRYAALPPIWGLDVDAPVVLLGGDTPFDRLFRKDRVQDLVRHHTAASSAA